MTADTDAGLRSVFEERWDEPAVLQGDEVTTYGGLLGTVERGRGLLDKLDVGPGDRVATLLPNDVGGIALYLAAAVRGAEIAPLDPERGPEELDELLDRADPDAVVAPASRGPDDLPRLGPNAAVEWLHRDTSIGRDRLELLDRIDAEAPWLVAFTSGSTGTPDGLVHSVGNLVRSARSFAERYDLGPERTYYHVLPMSYMAGILNTVVLPLVTGATVLLGERFGAATATRFWDPVEARGADTFWLVPAMIRLLLELDRSDRELPDDAVAFVGTAPIDAETKEAFRERYGIAVHESYGLSETLLVTGERPDAEDRGPVGPPLLGVEAALRDDGELLLDVPWTYLHDVDGRPPPRDDGWFPTGDLARRHPDGSLEITGRKKDVIVRGGANLSPKRIERILAEQELLPDCAMVGAPDPVLGERLVCLYTGESVSEADLDRARRTLVDRYGRDFRIDEFVEVETIPRTDSGEVDRSAVRERYREAGT